MSDRIDLGPEVEQIVTDLVESGRYGSPEEVLRAGVQLIVSRERRLAELDAAIEEGIADADAGRTIDSDALFDELIEHFSAYPHAAE